MHISNAVDIYEQGKNTGEEETKHSERCEWSKNTELECRTGDRVTDSLLVKNRHTSRTQAEGLWRSAWVVFVPCYWWATGHKTEMNCWNRVNLLRSFHFSAKIEKNKSAICRVSPCNHYFYSAFDNCSRINWNVRLVTLVRPPIHLFTASFSGSSLLCNWSGTCQQSKKRK